MVISNSGLKMVLVEQFEQLYDQAPWLTVV